MADAIPSRCITSDDLSKCCTNIVPPYAWPYRQRELHHAAAARKVPSSGRPLSDESPLANGVNATLAKVHGSRPLPRQRREARQGAVEPLRHA
jgi:hypothetical protein